MRNKLTIVMLIGLLVLNIGQFLTNRNLKLEYERVAEDNAMLTSKLDAALPITGRASYEDVFLRDKRAAVWDIRYTGFLELKKLVNPQTAQAVVKSVNSIYKPPKYPGINLQYIRNRTAYVRIQDQELLTQRMGSTGAWQYLAVVTASLTSLSGIDKVEFVFEAGDHARPGVYSRKDFLDLWAF